MASTRLLTKLDKEKDSSESFLTWFPHLVSEAIIGKRTHTRCLLPGLKVRSKSTKGLQLWMFGWFFDIDVVPVLWECTMCSPKIASVEAKFLGEYNIEGFDVMTLATDNDWGFLGKSCFCSTGDSSELTESDFWFGAKT